MKENDFEFEMMTIISGNILFLKFSMVFKVDNQGHFLLVINIKQNYFNKQTAHIFFSVTLPTNIFV